MREFEESSDQLIVTYYDLTENRSGVSTGKPARLALVLQVFQGLMRSGRRDGFHGLAKGVSLVCKVWKSLI